MARTLDAGVRRSAVAWRCGGIVILCRRAGRVERGRRGRGPLARHVVPGVVDVAVHAGTGGAGDVVRADSRGVPPQLEVVVPREEVVHAGLTAPATERLLRCGD